MRLIALLCLCMVSAYSVPDEVLHAQSTMEKIDSARVYDDGFLGQSCFVHAQDIELSVFRSEEQRGYSSVDISWNSIDPETRMLKNYQRHLQVYDHYINKENVGTVVARLPKITDPSHPDFDLRFSIILTDFTEHVPAGGGEVAYKWQAKVRSGKGWCSSSDARMTIRGNPTVFDETFVLR